MNFKMSHLGKILKLHLTDRPGSIHLPNHLPNSLTVYSSCPNHRAD
jgi:hypothetical protein